MHRACQLVLITASVVLFCDAGFIPFKRHHSVDPDVGRNVVSKRLSFRLLCAKDFHSFALLLMISVLGLEKKTFPENVKIFIKHLQFPSSFFVIYINPGREFQVTVSCHNTFDGIGLHFSARKVVITLCLRVLMRKPMDVGQSNFISYLLR